MTLSTAPLSLGRTGLANGGPGGCMPAKTTNAQIKRQMHDNHHVAGRNLPTPGTGEPGDLGIIWTEEASPDLSGGPPGAERGTRSVGIATMDDRTNCWR